MDKRMNSGFSDRPRPSRFRTPSGLTAAVIVLTVTLGVASTAGQQTKTISIHLKTRTGGSLDGLVVEDTDHGIVVVHSQTPYVFAWDELEPGSAIAAKRALLAFERGGREFLVANDHFELGLFALARSQGSAAGIEFRKAKKLDPAYENAVREALHRYRKGRTTPDRVEHPLADDPPEPPIEGDAPAGLLERMEAGLSDIGAPSAAVVQAPDEIRARVLAIYKSFGETVRQVISKTIVLVETDHFLIWTDWDKRNRPVLAQWCESMYAALCEQFDLDPVGSVFLAKCPIFCFRSKARFRRFARQFDGHEANNAIGYSRSIEKNGHVHLVLLRTGRSEADFDRLAATLVHEGTHAFLHRLYTTQLIPHWVNEGYADLIAERVMGDRCHNAENAALLARQYVRFDWPIRDLLASVEPIALHQYPIAHSVVAFLEKQGAERFAGFIKALKRGRTVTEALAAGYDGMTLDQLEARWRSSIQATDVADDRWQP